MASLYKKRDKNIRKTWFLITVFFIVIIGVGWFFSYLYGEPLILYIAVGFSMVMNIFAYWNSHKVVIKISGARPASEEMFPNLHNITENLAITSGLPKPKLYVINDPSPNAFATGRDKEHAVVAVTTGLLNILDRSELEGVIAHELSHIGNKDMLISTMVVVLVGFVTLLSDIFLRSLIFGGVRGGNDRGGNVQLILMIVGIALAILSPLIAILIQLSVSRKREFLADASGALLTRYPEGLASALEKIKNHSQRMKKVNHATAHLFISNPFGAKARKGFNKLWQTHPPVEERVKALREM